MAHILFYRMTFFIANSSHDFYPQAFVLPCPTSSLLMNLQYFDLSDNLLTDMTLTETLCNGNGTLKDLRVLNVSGNALKVPS